MIYRRYSVPSVWEEMNQVQREMNRLLDSVSRIVAMSFCEPRSCIGRLSS